MIEQITEFLSNPIIGALGLLFGLLGLIATLWIAYKDWKDPCRISFYPDQKINVFSDLTFPFSKLEIIYDDEMIDDNIVYLSGFFICDGKRDIITKENKINLILPKDSRWLDIDISSISDTLEETSDISIVNDEKATMTFDGFMKKESFLFRSLIETSDTSFDHKKIIFKQRIENTDKQVRVKEIKIRDRHKPLIVLFYVSILLIISMLGLGKDVFNLCFLILTLGVYAVMTYNLYEYYVFSKRKKELKSKYSEKDELMVQRQMKQTLARLLAKKTIAHRPPINFTLMGISVGDELVWKENPSIKITVQTDSTVLFNGKEMTINDVTSGLIESNSQIEPGDYWLYKDKLLGDIYNETYPLDD